MPKERQACRKRQINRREVRKKMFLVKPCTLLDTCHRATRKSHRQSTEQPESFSFFKLESTTDRELLPHENNNGSRVTMASRKDPSIIYRGSTAVRRPDKE